MFFVAFVPIWFWRNMAGVAYLVSILLLVVVELFGSVGMGAQRWIDLGFIRLQPSEMMKFTLVMMLAAYYDWLDAKRTSRPLWVAIPVAMILLPTDGGGRRVLYRGCQPVVLRHRRSDRGQRHRGRVLYARNTMAVSARLSVQAH
jgi:cell division protein FtsW (lipid II flippase)